MEQVEGLVFLSYRPYHNKNKEKFARHWFSSDTVTLTYMTVCNNPSCSHANFAPLFGRSKSRDLSSLMSTRSCYIVM